MITPEVVLEIERLLAEGTLSQRTIAKLTGVSRGTVGSVAKGTRRDPEESHAASREESDGPTGPRVRR